LARTSTNTGVTAKRPTRSRPPAARRSSQDAGRSKQASIIALLRSPSGATLAAMMNATGWQPHSVRGFLAGVVRKKLELRLVSEKTDGQRVYRIVDGDGDGPVGMSQLKRSLSDRPASDSQPTSPKPGPTDQPASGDKPAPTSKPVSA
jgi:hypothetical protein